MFIDAAKIEITRCSVGHDVLSINGLRDNGGSVGPIDISCLTALQAKSRRREPRLEVKKQRSNNVNVEITICDLKRRSRSQELRPIVECEILKARRIEVVADCDQLQDHS